MRPYLFTLKARVLTILVASAICLPLASAQQAGQLAEFERPYGYAHGQEQRPFEADTRDLHGNRVVINGLIGGGTSLGQGLYTGWGQTDGAAGMLGSGMALGNQLNVITNGSNNTIIIDSTQINTGDQTVIISGN
jgi:holdfast attachment protein HfaA